MAFNLILRQKKTSSGLKVDNSIAVNGTCLTVVRRKRNILTFDAVKETLSKTSLGGLRVGSSVNLERAVSLQQRLGGHLVQGHVDTTGTILETHGAKSELDVRHPVSKKISEISDSRRLGRGGRGEPDGCQAALRSF